MAEADRTVQIGGAGFRVLVSAAALVLVIAGLDAAQDILLPVVVAVFLSILTTPLMSGLQRLKVPTPIAIALVVVFVALVLVPCCYGSKKCSRIFWDFLRKF